MIRGWIAVVMGILFITGCKTSSVVKKTPSSVPVKNYASEAILDSMRLHGFHFNWFTGKAKVEVIDGSNKTEFTANFRIRNDSAIWISISPALGLEVARVLMTKDSIRVIDRLNNEYYSKDYNFFKTYTTLPLSFEAIQDLFEGNPLFTTQRQFEVTRVDSSYFLKWENELQTNSITLDQHYLHLKQTITDESSNSVSIMLEQYEIPDTSPFSLWRKIELLRPQSMQIVLTFSKIKINEPVKFPFHAKE